MVLLSESFTFYR
ncbi:thioesterase superfamily protein, partial [Vibrio parahaemolyticus VPTS-2010_2]